MNENNVFLYWVNKEYKLIKILRDIIYLHSKSGNGYKVHLITDKNLSEYISDLPDCFLKLCPAHQADFVRVCVVCDRGGIWLDSDTLVINSLDSLFEIVNNRDGFFIRQNNKEIWNGVFGSKANTPLMVEWKKCLISTLNTKKEKIGWTEIGNTLLENFHTHKKHLYTNYTIFEGLDNMYPVNWDKCVDEFIKKPYENYKKITREFQPLIVLVNSVYKSLEDKTEIEILEGELPLNYFLNLSLQKKINDTRGDTFTEEKRNENTNNKIIFETIYEKKIWNNNNSSIPLSGPGSSLQNTKDISQLLTEFIYKNKCKTILDLGCGDLTWISRTPFFNDSDIKYTGVDIVESLINKHAEKYKQHPFVCKDLVNLNVIQPVSLIIIRDVLFHLKNEDIQVIFNNIRDKFDFIAITSCKNEVNTDNFNKWHFTEKNIHKPPFNRAQSYLNRIDEPVFNRLFYIFSHELFYN
jgi:hypothetical protein